MVSIPVLWPSGSYDIASLIPRPLPRFYLTVVEKIGFSTMVCCTPEAEQYMYMYVCLLTWNCRIL